MIWKLILANKGLAFGILFLLAIGAFFIVNTAKLSKANERIAQLETIQEKDKNKILDLEREVIALRQSNEQCFTEYGRLKKDFNEVINLIPKSMGKALSTKYPSIEQIKNNQ